MSQKNLFNTSSLSSARQMRHLKRERLIKDSGIKRVIPPPKPKPDFVETAFTLPHEERFYPVTHLGPCSQCSAQNRSELHCAWPQPNNPVYQVVCSLCKFRGPEFPRPEQAIRHWKLISALIK